MKFHSIALTNPIHNSAPSFRTFFFPPPSSPSSLSMSLPRTNPILLIFLSRACKGSYSSSSSSDCTPIAVCRCYETIDLSLSLFFPPTLSLPHPGLKPPVWRLLTLCIRCNRVPVFRQSAFSKNGCVVEWYFLFPPFFFCHIQRFRIPWIVVVGLDRAYEGNSASKSLGL